jgi:tryptophanyl-tRNA synthetase
MSKSAGEKHYINVFAEDAALRKQIKSAVTDTGDTPSGEMSAGVANLFELLKACGKLEAHNSLMDDYLAGALKYAPLKEVVADALAEKSAIFRENKRELTANKKLVKEQIKDSSASIRQRAQQTVLEVKELCGLLNVRF